MKLAKIVHALLLLGAYFCAASTAAQAIGVGVLWSRGGLTRERISQYAAVLYGLVLPPAPADPSRARTGIRPANRRSRRINSPPAWTAVRC